jgi:hypothetical protein
VGDQLRALVHHRTLLVPVEGCAVVAVTVAGPDVELLDHAGAIFRAWTDQLVGLFVAGGVAEDSARPIAVTIIAATEGAAALCRAEKSREPFDVVAVALTQMVVSHLRLGPLAIGRMLRPAWWRVLPVLLAPVGGEVEDVVDEQQPVDAPGGCRIGPIDVGPVA